MCEISDSSRSTVDIVKQRISSPYVALVVDEEDKDCKICTRQIPVNPTTLGCGHTFCRICVEVLVLDDETIPFGRQSADVFCPVCSRGNTVQWIIDDCHITKADSEQFNLVNVKYDLNRKRATQKYRQLIRHHLRHWREIMDPEVDCEQDQFNFKRDHDDLSGHVNLLHDDRNIGNDIRGINHVTGCFVECIVLQGQPSSLSTVVSESCKSGSTEISPVNGRSDQHVSSGNHSLESDQPRTPRKHEFYSNSDKEFERSVSERSAEISFQMEIGQQQQREWSIRQSELHKMDDEGVTSPKCIPLNFSNLTLGKGKEEEYTLTDHCVQFRTPPDNDRVVWRSIKEWCAHFLVVGFILLICGVIVTTTIIRAQ